MRALLVLVPALFGLGLTLALADGESGGGGDGADRGGAGRDAEAVARGARLFHDTGELEYPSCAHCHSVLPEEREAKEEKHVPPGSTLFGSALRAGWRNRKTYADVGAASVPCARQWQERVGKRALKAAQVADLEAYLETLVPDGSEQIALPARKVATPKLPESLEGGDEEKGEALAQRYCGGCHGASADAVSFELQPHKKRKEQIARKVRGYDKKGKFKPKGGMSYFPRERLSDEDLLHILAWHGR